MVFSRRIDLLDRTDRVIDCWQGRWRLKAFAQSPEVVILKIAAGFLFPQTQQGERVLDASLHTSAVSLRQVKRPRPMCRHCW